jgi:hypothetical protein
VTTPDRPKLDRRVYFDDESRNYPIRKLIPRTAKLRKRIWTLPPVFPLDQGREGACFPGGTFVRMADGSQRRIEEIKLLDEVVTAEGRIGTVLQTMVRRADDGLVRVNLRGHLDLRCTPEHPVLTQRGYVPAKELTAGDRVAITCFTPKRTDPISTTDVIDLSEFRGIVEGRIATGGVVSEIARIPELIGKTPALGRLVGLYAAEGHTTANKVVWSYGGHEKDTLVQETISLIKSAFDATARIQVRPNNSINVVLYGKTWRLLFEALVPGTSKWGDKHLSPLVTSGSPDYLAAILAGWLDGDGHRRRHTVTGISVSRNLSLDMHAIGTALGRRPVIRESAPSMNRHAATRQMRYDVEFSNGGGTNVVPQDDTAMWRRVNGVEREPFDGHVFNLHVEGDESYVADGVGVHNCVGFGWSAELSSTPIKIPTTNSSARTLYMKARLEDQLMGNDWDEGASVLAGAKACLKDRNIKSYRWAFGIEDVLYALSNIGSVVLGIDWHSGMYDTSPGGLVDVSGPIVGGHCILANGYWPNHPEFGDVVVWTNSWGRSYGVNGRGYIKVDDLTRLLQRNGEACVALDRRPLLVTLRSLLHLES